MSICLPDDLSLPKSVASLANSLQKRFDLTRSRDLEKAIELACCLQVLTARTTFVRYMESFIYDIPYKGNSYIWGHKCDGLALLAYDADSHGDDTLRAKALAIITSENFDQNDLEWERYWTLLLRKSSNAKRGLSPFFLFTETPKYKCEVIGQEALHFLYFHEMIPVTREPLPADFADTLRGLIDDCYHHLQEALAESRVKGRKQSQKGVCPHFSLIDPVVVCQGHAVEQLPSLAPVGQQPVHIGLEAVVVVAFQQVHQFVHQNVLQALRWFLGQFQIQPDAAGLSVAAAPFGFHLFHPPVCHFDTGAVLPEWQQLLHPFFQLVAIEGIQCPLAIVHGSTHLDTEMQFSVVGFYLMATGPLDHFQPVMFAPEVVALPADHLSVGLPGLFSEIVLLFSDPGNAADHRHADGGIAHGFRGRDTHAAIGWQHADMQMLDRLAIDLHGDGADFHGCHQWYSFWALASSITLWISTS